MRYSDNGFYFTVSYSSKDAFKFADAWPNSSVDGKGSFEFDDKGDIVGTNGSAQTSGSDADWKAFMEKCKEFGMKRRNKPC